MSVVPVVADKPEIPKYEQIVTAIQERITSGVYGPGTMIPSEWRLVEEFGASRPVVVRALGILQQDGWIESEHGRGRFVRRSHAAQTRTTGAGRELFGAEKRTGVRILSVDTIPAPTRLAVGLGLEVGAAVVARTRLVTSTIGPLQLVTLAVPADLAVGTDLVRRPLLMVDPLAHLSAVKGVSFDYATDRISARPATADEASLLDINRRDPVLTVLVTAFDTTGTPRLVADATIVPTRMELEDSFLLN